MRLLTTSHVIMLWSQGSYTEFAKTQWHGTNYTDTTIYEEFQLEGYVPTWCADMHLLRARATP